LPADIRIAPAPAANPRTFGFSVYLNHLRKQLATELHGAEVIIPRGPVPNEIWVRPPGSNRRWFVARWIFARPATPVAMILVLLGGALLVLSGAGWFARRMTIPLANLVTATDRVAAGERVTVDTGSGPSEVRSLATAFQSMSNRLAELDEQRELMLAGLSHDLRSPLARVRVAVELLEEPNIALAQQMSEEIETIDRMIGQFMQYVRAGYSEAPTLVRPDDVVRDVTAPMTVELELHASELRWIAVESLRHVLINLIQNAAEYGQAPVTVRTELRPGELRISVSDRGIGLSPEEWQQAVQPFHRLRQAPGTGHSGLGLALVDRLVQVGRGKLSARRTATGFVVEVTLAADGYN